MKNDDEQDPPRMMYSLSYTAFFFQNTIAPSAPSKGEGHLLYLYIYIYISLVITSKKNNNNIIIIERLQRRKKEVKAEKYHRFKKFSL